MAEPSAPAAGRKINRSCQECTRRKVKCDGGHPCAACTHNQTADTCEYQQRSRRHAVSRSALAKALEQLQQQSGTLQAYCRVTHKLFPGLSIDELDGKSRADLLHMLRGPPLETHSTSHQDAAPVGQEVDNTLEASTEISEGGDPLAERSWEESAHQVAAIHPSDDINAIGLATDQHSRSYLGVTSISAVMKVIFSLCPTAKQHTAERARTWNESHHRPRQPVPPGLLPSLSTTGPNALRELRCIGFYFDTVHAITPIINEEEFRAQYAAANRHDRSWLALLNMVLTLGSLASGSDTLHNQYYEQARIHLDLDSLGSGNTELLQALCLLGGYYLHYRNSPNMAYALLGAAHRVAVALGLHREPVRTRTVESAEGSLGHDGNSRHDARVETRRRTWWGLFCLDTWASMTLGRPTCGRWDSTTMNTLLPSPTSPDDYMAASLRASCLFCSICDRIQHRFAQPARLSAQEALAFDRELTEWHGALPAELRDPAVVVPRLTVARDFMRNRYLNVRLVLSRCFLLYHAHDSRLRRRSARYTETSPEEAALIQSCRAVASEVIDAITLSWTPNRIHVWNSAWYLFQACMVPLLSIAMETDHCRSLLLVPRPQQQQQDLPARPGITPSAAGVAGSYHSASAMDLHPGYSALTASCRGSLIKAIETFVEMSPWMRPSDRALDIVVALYEALTAEVDEPSEAFYNRTPSAGTDSSLDAFGWFDEKLVGLEWDLSLDFDGLQNNLYPAL
ncbi:transcriptional regulatory protein GAL4 [Microdochium nivale]|nr:transcriptional regulatory protein GAL4 [Microdochium nivale]